MNDNNRNLTNNIMLCKYYPPTPYSLDALINEYFWFSKTENLNDPFDIVGFQSLRTNTDFRRLLDYCNAHNFLPDLNKISKLLADTKKYAMCSFSRTCTNRLMWAYYAQAYSGWCIGFNPNIHLCVSSYLHPQDAIYVNGHYDINPISSSYILDGKTKYDKTLNFLLRIKHEDWMHEQEQRMFVKTPYYKGVRQNWNPGAMITIILGNKISSEYENIVKAIIKEKNKRRLQNQMLPIVVYRISRNVKSFNLKLVNSWV